MSHFSTIKTKFKDAEQLVEALIDIGLDDAQHEQSVMVVSDKEHAKGHPNVEVHITAGNDIGFRWNKETEAYDIVAKNIIKKPNSKPMCAPPCASSIIWPAVKWISAPTKKNRSMMTCSPA